MHQLLTMQRYLIKTGTVGPFVLQVEEFDTETKATAPALKAVWEFVSDLSTISCSRQWLMVQLYTFSQSTIPFLFLCCFSSGLWYAVMHVDHWQVYGAYMYLFSTTIYVQSDCDVLWLCPYSHCVRGSYLITRHSCFYISFTSWLSTKNGTVLLVEKGSRRTQQRRWSYRCKWSWGE